MDKEQNILNLKENQDLIVTEKVVIIPRHSVVNEEELHHLLPQLKSPIPNTSQRKYHLDPINVKATLNYST